MAEEKVKTIGVLTSGGDAPGMNAAIRAVVRRGLVKGFRIKGIRRGYLGLCNAEIIDMEADDVSNILQRGGTILETERYPGFAETEVQQKAVDICRKHGIDALVIIGGDGSFAGAEKLAALGLNVIGIPGTIDGDIGCTDYTIGFDTAINTAMRAIDNIQDTASSHERCSMIEVMGRNAGYIALWCGLACGAEQALIPETFDHNEKKVAEKILKHRARGKNNNIIVNAEGAGTVDQIAEKVSEYSGISIRKTVLSYIQRGGSPTCRDRVVASIMGAMAVDILEDGGKNRVIAMKKDDYVDYDIHEALQMKGSVPAYMEGIMEDLAL